MARAEEQIQLHIRIMVPLQCDFNIYKMMQFFGYGSRSIILSVLFALGKTGSRFLWGSRQDLGVSGWWSKWGDMLDVKHVPPRVPVS